MKSTYLYAAAQAFALARGVSCLSPSPKTTSDLEYFSQYAAAAYCKQRIGSPVACGLSSCPRVAAANATVLSTYEELPPFQTTGFVAADHSIKSLVFTFRGAEGLGFLTAFTEFLSQCDSICAGCQCSNGFYTSWISARDIIKQQIAAARKKYPDYSITATGHSLGAVQSSLAAAEFRQNGTATKLYTYGGPRLGDEKLVAHVTKQGNNFRVTHTDDPAPRMGSVQDGLRHFSPEYWISKDTSDFYVLPEDIQIIQGYNNNTGNAGTGGFDALAHVQYFQKNIGACFLPVLGL